MVSSSGASSPPGNQEDLARQAALGAYLDGQSRERLIPEDYTTISTVLTPTGHHPGGWWRAQAGTIPAATDPIPQMPERYSPSSATTERRTHRMTYRMGDTSVRMPSRAAIRRYIRDHPNLETFDVPVEAVTGMRRGMGFVRMRRNEESGRWEAVAGSGAFAGDGTFADTVRSQFTPIIGRQRPRVTRSQGQAAVRAAQPPTSPTEVEWRPVESSFIAQVGYNPTSRYMAVEFRTGQIAGYSNVPTHEFEAFVAADSVGSYYQRFRRNPAYMAPTTPVIEATPEPSDEAAPPATTVTTEAQAQADSDRQTEDGNLVDSDDHQSSVEELRAGAPNPLSGLTVEQLAEPRQSSGGSDHYEWVSDPNNPVEGTVVITTASGARYQATTPMTRSTYEALLNGDTFTDVWNRHIAGGLATAPPRGTGTQHCRDCGQFVGDGTGHECSGRAEESDTAAPVEPIATTGTVTADISFDDPNQTIRRIQVTTLGPGHDPQLEVTTTDDESGFGVLAGATEIAAVTGTGERGPDPAVITAIVDRRLEVHDGIEMLPMGSTHIRTAGYDPTTRRLRVQMHDRRAFTYLEVPAEVWDEFRVGSTPDQFYDQEIARQYRTGPQSRIYDQIPLNSNGRLYSPQVPGTFVRRCGFNRDTNQLLVLVGANGTSDNESPPAALYTFAGTQDEFHALMGSDDPDAEYRRLQLNTRTFARLNGFQVGEPRTRLCPGCRTPIRDDQAAHECPGPAGARIPRTYPRSRTIGINTATYTDGRVQVEMVGGGLYVAHDITPAEFGRFDADPAVTLALWRSGRRATDPTAEVAPLNALPMPREFNRVRSSWNHSSDQFGLREDLTVPPMSQIRTVARNETEPFYIPVQASLRDPDQGDEPRMTTGHLRVTRGARRRLVVEDDGHLSGDDDMRRQTVETVNAMLAAQRVRGTFANLRQARLAASDALRGRAEASQAARAALQQVWAARAASTWESDMDAFQAVYDETHARKAAGEPPIAYRRENVTGGMGSPEGGRGFGVELEFNFPATMGAHAKVTARRAILQEMRDEGLIGENHPDRFIGYGAQRTMGYTNWTCTEDCTVDGEIVSPVMWDTPEHWDQLAKVCEIIKRHGGTAQTGRAGNHVHVGAGDYDDTVENHNRLLGDFTNYQDLLYRLGTNPERGRHRGINWCHPNRTLPANGYSRVSQIRYQHGHGTGLNFASVNGTRDDHVEFRQWDGTLDPAVIQTQILVSLGMTEAALAGRSSDPMEREPLGRNKALNPRRRRLSGEEWENTTRSFRRMVDRLFYRDEDKAAAASLYAITRWQSR